MIAWLVLGLGLGMAGVSLWFVVWAYGVVEADRG